VSRQRRAAARVVPARTAMAIVGHADIRTTMNIYTHALDESKRDAADAMDDLFGGTSAAM
jgi:integrase